LNARYKSLNNHRKSYTIVIKQKESGSDDSLKNMTKRAIKKIKGGTPDGFDIISGGPHVA